MSLDNNKQPSDADVFIERFSKEIPEILESTYFLNNDIILSYPKDLFPSPTNLALFPLARLMGHQDSSKYNSVLSPQILNLHNNCVDLTRTYDVFQSIELSCVNSVTDISSVTLFATLSLPRKYNQEELYKWAKSSFSLEKSAVFPHEFYSPNSEDYTVFNFPIKSVSGLTTNKVEFFDKPLLLCRAIFVNFYIEVEYSNAVLGSQDLPVKINYLLLYSDIRRALLGV